MWVKISSTVKDDKTVFTFTEDDLLFCEYGFLPSKGTYLELKKIFGDTNKLEDAMMHFQNQRVKVEIYSGDTLVRTVNAMLQRYHLLEEAVNVGNSGIPDTQKAETPIVKKLVENVRFGNIIQE